MYEKDVRLLPVVPDVIACVYSRFEARSGRVRVWDAMVAVAVDMSQVRLRTKKNSSVDAMSRHFSSARYPLAAPLLTRE